VQHAGPVSYRFVVDRVDTHAGAASLRIDSIGNEPYGSMWQVLPAHGMQGQTVVLTGWLRARAAGNASDGGGALLLQALRSGYVVAQGVAQPAAARGTTPWSRYESRLLVPAQADGLRVGVTLVGRGTVWADELVLAVTDGS
jgi:hypothetical protein